jgi:hypothetical protein
MASRASLLAWVRPLLVAGLAARDLDLCDEPAGGIQDRGGVAVAVGIDPNDMLDPAL